MTAIEKLRSVLRDHLPLDVRVRLRQRIRRLSHPAWLGTLRRTSPLSEFLGVDRGTPLDRHYIDAFIARHRRDIAGRVLEVRDRRYSSRFGTGVVSCEVLDINPENHTATIIADLAACDGIPDDTFDCFISTQVLQYVYDLRAALMHARRILCPGGVFLATLPALARLDHPVETDIWRFTRTACERLFGEAFGEGNVVVESHGNVLAACAFLMGMAKEELSPQHLDVGDPYFPVIIAVRAVKA